MSAPVPSSPKRQLVVLLEPITPKVNDQFSAELKKVINERNILTTKTRRRVSEALEDIASESAAIIRKTKKEKLLSEITNTEEAYVAQLEVILEFFIKPTLEKSLLSAEDFETLFGNIKTIYKINKELLTELRKGNEHVAQAFSKIAPLFKCYSFYASGYRRSLELLQNCHKRNAKFARFLEMQETRPEVQSKLSALLIAPIQRVPRYKLLLQSVCRLSLRTQDYEIFSDSLSKVAEAADHINKIIKDQENMQRLIELQRCMISGEPTIIVPGRYLIKEGPLLKISSKSTFSVKRYIVLTNDIIMFCKMKRDELKVNSLKCTRIYPLGKCKVQEVLDKGAFKVICQDLETVLYHESLSETIKWVAEIKEAIQVCVDDRKTLKKESTVRRPVKRKDLAEYNEVGLSPGKKLRKRKSQVMEDANSSINRYTFPTRRRPLVSFNSVNYQAPSIFVTLKPKEEAQRGEENIGDSGGKSAESSRDVFVFGQPQPDRGFSFKMNKFICGIGTSVKRLFGFRN